VAKGTASSLGSNSVWILDYDGGYTVDSRASITDGRWAAIDQPLGDASNHLPYSLTMVAALANPACAAVLTRLDAGSNDYTNSLPQGCKLFGQVTVNVTRP